MPSVVDARPAGGRGRGVAKKGYRNKSHALEVVVRDKLNALSRLQADTVFLKQKGSVLEVLLEVASEIAVHKRQHTGTKFPELRDAQLLEFLETFLAEYGGYAADRPTMRNYFKLERLSVDEFKGVRKEDFLSKYTSLVQRLSLLLLQATDDSMKGGLAATIDDLKQLLLGILLWSPLTFMQVGTHNLVSGDPIQPDPEHSAGCISRIHLSQEQQDVLAIIGDLYNNQVGALESTHGSLCQQLDSELGQDTSSSLAGTIMRVSSNMHRLLATHQLFHVAIMHNLLDQQLALLCVRCFPRFPCMQDLLNALVRIRDSKASAGGSGSAAAAAAAAAAGGGGLGAGARRTTLDVPPSAGAASDSGAAVDAAAAAAAAAADASNTVGGPNLLGDATASLLQECTNMAQKPLGAAAAAPETSVLSKGRLAEAGSKLLQAGTGLFKQEPGSAAAEKADGSPDVEAAATAAAAAVAAAAASGRQGMFSAPVSDLVADVIKGPGRDWDVLHAAERDEPGSSTPVRPDSSKAAGAALPQGSSQKQANSPAPSATTNSRSAGGGGGASKNPGSNSSAQPSGKRSRAAMEDKWPSGKQHQQHRKESGMDMAAAAAAGMLDPAAAAALPVPIGTLPVQQQAAARGPLNSSSALLQPGLVQQLAAQLSAAGGGPGDIMQLVATQPKLAMLMQPQLLGMLQDAMQQHQQHNADQQQQLWQQQQQQQLGMPDLSGQQGYGAAYGRPAADALMRQQGRHWPSSAHAAAGYAGAGGRPPGMPALEMLPPSLSVGGKEAPNSSPLQALLRSVASLLQACSNVSDAAMAAADAGQGEFVASTVSAAEAALGTALKSLQEVKARCSSSGGGGHNAAAGGRSFKGPTQAAAAAAGALYVPAAAGASPAAAAAAAGMSMSMGMGLGLPPAGPSQGRLQPPAGIPMPGPSSAQQQQQQLPQSLAMALSGMHAADPRQQQQQHPAHSSAGMLASMGLSQGAAGTSHPMAMAGNSSRPPHTVSNHPAAAGLGHSSGGGSSSSRAMPAPHGQQQQQPSISSLVQQLSALGDNPATIAQAVQLLQQQNMGPEVSAALGQLVGQGGPLDLSSLLAVFQQPPSGNAAAKAPAPDAMQVDAPSAGGGPAAATAPPASAAAVGGGSSKPLPGSSLDVTQSYSAALEAAAAAIGAAPTTGAPVAGAATAAAAAAARGGRPAGAEGGKEGSPSAGSSTTNTGQSGRHSAGPEGQQPQGAAGAANPSLPAAATANAAAAVANSTNPAAAQQQQQQLEAFARSAAAAMAGQLRGPGETEAFVSTVMQLLQGQLGTDGAAAGLKSMAGVLQAMTGAGPAAGASTAPPQHAQRQLQQHHLQQHPQQHQQQHPQLQHAGALVAPTLDPAAAAALRLPMGQSPAAAATFVPPAAAAAMAAKRAAAMGGMQGGPAAAGDFMDVEADAASALEMLASAAVCSQQDGGVRKRPGNPRDPRDPR